MVGVNSIGYETSRGGGVLPYKSDGGAHLKFSKQPLKDTKILFCCSFPPLILKQHIYWHYDNYF